MSSKAFHLRQMVRVSAVIACLTATVVLSADDNACCGPWGDCNCSAVGCENSWVCNQVVLDQIRSCCGFMAGTATCNQNYPGQCAWCVDCTDTEDYCGYCDTPF
jgi:hypothetical protein